MSDLMDRREFLQETAVASAAVCLPRIPNQAAATSADVAACIEDLPEEALVPSMETFTAAHPEFAAARNAFLVLDHRNVLDFEEKGIFCELHVDVGNRQNLEQSMNALALAMHQLECLQDPTGTIAPNFLSVRIHMGNARLPNTPQSTDAFESVVYASMEKSRSAAGNQREFTNIQIFPEPDATTESNLADAPNRHYFGQNQTM